MIDQSTPNSDSDELEYKNLKQKYAKLEQEVQKRKTQLARDLEKQELLEKKQRYLSNLKILEEQRVFDKLQILWDERKNPLLKDHPSILARKDILYFKEIRYLIIALDIIFAWLFLFNAGFHHPVLYFITNLAGYVLLFIILLFPNKITNKYIFKGSFDIVNSILLFSFSSKNPEYFPKLKIEFSSFFLRVTWNKSSVMAVKLDPNHYNELFIDKQAISFHKNSFEKESNWLNDFNKLFNSFTTFIEADLKKKTALLEQELVDTSFMVSND